MPRLFGNSSILREYKREDTLALIFPTKEYERQILDYKKEFETNGDSMDGTAGLKNACSIDEWLFALMDNSNEETVRVGLVPASTYLAVKILQLLNDWQGSNGNRSSNGLDLRGRSHILEPQYLRRIFLIPPAVVLWLLKISRSSIRRPKICLMSRLYRSMFDSPGRG